MTTINKEYVERVSRLQDFMFETCKNKYNHDLVNASYKKLEDSKSKIVRDLFTKCVNKLNLDPSKPLYTTDGVKIAEGFERIVIGDYGAFIEYDLNQVPKDVKYFVPNGEKYRLTPRYKNRVKYIWYSVGNGWCKIYWQLRGVSYADYKPKKFYISPYEVIQ